MIGQLTHEDEDRIENGMNNSFKGGDSGTPAVKVVVRSKIPARQPNGHIVSHAKKPNKGEVGEGNNARTIRCVPQDLSDGRAKAASTSQMKKTGTFSQERMAY